MLDELKMMRRYAADLDGFLRERLTLAQARRLIEHHLADRRNALLRVLQHGVFGNPGGPYARLFANAGLGFEDAADLVREHGVEGTLERLHDAGIFVTLDEFKGRRPIERPGMSIPTGAIDFDNPVLSGHFAAQTSGSRGRARRIIVDLELIAHEAAYLAHFVRAFGVQDRPVAMWRATPPVTSGIKLLLRYAKLGVPLQRWFSQNRPGLGVADLKFRAFTEYTIRRGRKIVGRLPAPQFVGRDEAAVIARWLSEMKARHGPISFDTNASSAVRVCLAAQREGLDIAGTFFRVGGEPLTQAKAKVVADSGCLLSCHYSIAEVGHIGIGCADPAAPDDVHIVADKIAILQREKRIGESGRSVGALVLTSLMASCPKLMLNVEVDDYGILERRDCRCLLGELGLSLHLHDIRSYEKLTSDGVTFLGTELMRLLEEVLPATYGGRPTEYQLVESEEGGLPVVSLLIHPRIGEMDSAAVLATVYETLRQYPGGDIMVNQWQQGNMLRVLRRAPYATRSSKINALHTLK